MSPGLVDFGLVCLGLVMVGLIVAGVMIRRLDVRRVGRYDVEDVLVFLGIVPLLAFALAIVVELQYKITDFPETPLAHEVTLLT